MMMMVVRVSCELARVWMKGGTMLCGYVDDERLRHDGILTNQPV